MTEEELIERARVEDEKHKRDCSECGAKTYWHCRACDVAVCGDCKAVHEMRSPHDRPYYEQKLGGFFDVLANFARFENGHSGCYCAECGGIRRRRDGEIRARYKLGVRGNTLLGILLDAERVKDPPKGDA